MKKLLPLFLNESFRGAAISFLTLFSSVYIYKTVLIESFNEKIALLAIILFYFIVDFSKFWANFLAQKIAYRWDLRIPMYVGEGLLILFFILLFFNSNLFILLFISPLILGIAAGLYWYSRHGLMAKIGSFHHFGLQVGQSGIINTILLIAAPFVGGIIITSWDYQGLFLGAALLTVISILFLGKLENKKINHLSNFIEIMDLFKKHKRMCLTYAANAAIATIYIVIFPVYLFLIFYQEITLGEFFSLAIILAAIVNLIIGRFNDDKGKSMLIRWGAVISSIVWFSRFLVKIPLGLLIVDVVDRLTSGLTAIPLNVLSYQKAIDGHDTSRAILFRELAIGIGGMLAGIIMAVIIILGIKIEIIFIIAAGLSLLQLLILKGEDLDE